MTHCDGGKKYCHTSNTLSELCCTCDENAFRLLVISWESVICSVVSLFLCFLTTEWAITQARAGPCVCGIQGSGIHSACFLWGKGAIRANCLHFAFVSKTGVPLGFPGLFFSITLMPFKQRDWPGNRESNGDIRASLGSHQADLGHNCSGLKLVNETPQEGDTLKKYMHPSLMQLLLFKRRSLILTFTDKVRGGGGIRPLYLQFRLLYWLNAMSPRELHCICVCGGAVGVHTQGQTPFGLLLQEVVSLCSLGELVIAARDPVPHLQQFLVRCKCRCKKAGWHRGCNLTSVPRGNLWKGLGGKIDIAMASWYFEWRYRNTNYHYLLKYSGITMNKRARFIHHIYELMLANLH